MSFHMILVAVLWSNAAAGMAGSLWLFVKGRTWSSRTFALLLLLLGIKQIDMALQVGAGLRGEFEGPLLPWFGGIEGLALVALPVVLLLWFPRRTRWAPQDARGWAWLGGAVALYGVMSWVLYDGGAGIAFRAAESAGLAVVGLVLVVQATRGGPTWLQRAALLVAAGMFFATLPGWVGTWTRGWVNMEVALESLPAVWWSNMAVGGVVIASAVAAVGLVLKTSLEGSDEPAFLLFAGGIALVGLLSWLLYDVGMQESIVVVHLLTHLAFVAAGVIGLLMWERAAGAERVDAAEPTAWLDAADDAPEPTRSAAVAQERPETERGEADRFHPRLGLEERDT